MKLYYVQVFLKCDYNFFGYFTKQELKNEEIKYFTILQRVK